MEPVISVRNLTKEFWHINERPQSLKSYLVNFSKGNLFSTKKQRMRVLDGISFDVHQGEIVGIMGRNGTGKSTLFRLLSGIYVPNSGKIEVRQPLAALVGLGAGFNHELTGYENIFLNGSIIGFSRSEMASVLDRIIDFSELGEHINAPVKNYSSGMVLRLGFSIAAHIDAPILLLDEILGVGDEGFQRKSLAKILSLIEEGRTIILVTHDPKSVLDHCTRCMILEHGQIQYDGTPQEGVKRYSALFADHKG